MKPNANFISEADFATLIQQLAAALSITTRQTWKIVQQQEDRYHATLQHSSYQICFYAYRQRGTVTDRLRCSGIMGKYRERLDKPERDESTNITCAIDRGYQAIAADINNRLWTVYKRLYDLGKAKHLAYEAFQQHRHETAVHLAHILHKSRTVSDDWRSNPYNLGDPGFGWGYHETPLNSKGSVKVDYWGNVRMEIRDLDPLKAAQILYILAE